MTNGDHLEHVDKPLTDNEKFKARIAILIAKFVYANDIKKAIASKVDIVIFVHKMSSEFTNMATSMKIQLDIIANVNNNYLFALSKPNITPESLIKEWMSIN